MVILKFEAKIFIFTANVYCLQISLSLIGDNRDIRYGLTSRPSFLYMAASSSSSQRSRDLWAVKWRLEFQFIWASWETSCSDSVFWLDWDSPALWTLMLTFCGQFQFSTKCQCPGSILKDLKTQKKNSRGYKRERHNFGMRIILLMELPVKMSKPILFPSYLQ